MSMRLYSSVFLMLVLLGGGVRGAASTYKSRGHHAAAPAHKSTKHTEAQADEPAPVRHRGRHAEAVDTPAPRHGRRVTRLSLRLAREAAATPLRGSLESLTRQNERTEADGLERILDDDDLHDRIVRGQLVPVPVSEGLIINGDLPVDRRYCRPWTATFLSDLASAHTARFHRALDVSSAVRTEEFQKKLMRHNRNAAPADGDIASPHLTGATIDIAKSPLSNQEREWMRQFLLPLQQAGKIDVEEEFRQSCFHITVYKSYLSDLPEPDWNAPPPGLVAAQGQ